MAGSRLWPQTMEGLVWIDGSVYLLREQRIVGRDTDNQAIARFE